VHLDGILLSQLVGNKEGRDVFTLVSLKLQHLAEFFVFNNTAVATVLCKNIKNKQSERDSRKMGWANTMADHGEPKAPEGSICGIRFEKAMPKYTS
jgi:hypothetical protein